MISKALFSFTLGLALAVIGIGISPLGYIGWVGALDRARKGSWQKLLASLVLSKYLLATIKQHAFPTKRSSLICQASCLNFLAKVGIDLK